MDLDETLSWPFFDDGHRRFAQALARWADATLPALPHDDVDAACRARVKALADAGFLKAVVPAEHGGLHPRLDVRTLCLAREILAFRDGLADFAFAMQGLGTGSISLFGSTELQARYLPPVRDGRAIAAFALSEPEAGSDVAALAMTATPDGPSHLRIDGVKTWISNGGIADHYVVFARTGEARRQGVGFMLPMMESWLADLYAKAGESALARSIVEAALENISNGRSWEAELHRQHGQLLLALGPSSMEEAETHLQNSIDVARGQGAKSLELRAATSLAELRRAQGRANEARALLEPVVGWFEEGADTVDVKRGRETLNALG